MYKKYKRLVYMPPDLLARFCKVNLLKAKNWPDLFSRPNLRWSRVIIALKCDRRWLLFLEAHTCIECFHMTSRWPYWCPKTMKRRPCWCPKPDLWELNSFLMQMLTFVQINLHRCWPREWKHSIRLLNRWKICFTLGLVCTLFFSKITAYPSWMCP